MINAEQARLLTQNYYDDVDLGRILNQVEDDARSGLNSTCWTVSTRYVNNYKGALNRLGFKVAELFSDDVDDDSTELNIVW